MKLVYEFTAEDTIEFNKLNCDISPKIKKIMIKNILIETLILIVVFIFFYVKFLSLSTLFFGIIFIAISLFFSKKRYLKKQKKLLKKILYTKSQKKVFGQRTLTINEDGLNILLQFSNIDTKWEAVERVVLVKNYLLLLYETDIQAHVINREHIIDGDFELFLEEIKKYKEIENFTK